MNFPHLFSPLKVGPYQLKHRVALAPLTRMRAAKPSLVPRPLNAEYYAQRATPGGLLIAEASPVMATGFGSPGVARHLYRRADRGLAQGRRRRPRQGRVHLPAALACRPRLAFLVPARRRAAGRALGGRDPAELKTSTADGKVATYETPRALETDEIPAIVEAYRQAARNALAAGFDGVEIHGANGYLIEQFLQSRTNLRTDRYGGSIENRVRFLLEVTQAVDRRLGRRPRRRAAVALRHRQWQRRGRTRCRSTSMRSKQLNPLGLAYLHFIEPRSSGAGRAEVNWQGVPSAMVLFRPIWKGVLITAGGFTGETADAAIADGHADAIAFGRIFISNPDLPLRLQHGYPLTPYNRKTFYGGDVAGYTDYPFYDAMAPA